MDDTTTRSHANSPRVIRADRNASEVERAEAFTNLLERRARWEALLCHRSTRYCDELQTSAGCEGRDAARCRTRLVARVSAEPDAPGGSGSRRSELGDGPGGPQAAIRRSARIAGRETRFARVESLRRKGQPSPRFEKERELTSLMLRPVKC